MMTRWRMAQRRAKPKPLSVRRQMKPSLDLAWPASAGSSFRKRAQSMGVRVKETNRLIMTAKATVRPKLLKNLPTIPPMNAIGTKITTRERLVASTAKAISEVPSREPEHGDVVQREPHVAHKQECGND